MIEYGAAAAWPQPGVPLQIIRNVLITVGKTIGVAMTPTTPTKTIFRKIMNLVHTKRFLRAGVREYYAALACGAMLQQCYNITEGA